MNTAEKIPAIAVINAGSSSVKCALFSREGLHPLMGFHAEGFGAKISVSAHKTSDNGQREPLQIPNAQHIASHSQAMLAFFTQARRLGFKVVCAGHRIVHGGTRFVEPALITPEIRSALEALVPLAPLHQPHNLAGVDAVSAVDPDLPQFACFDTAFHANAPLAAKRIPIPEEFHLKGVMNYGFHGLSYAYVSQAMQAAFPGFLEKSGVVAHLGNGSSACAIANGQSQGSSMGFTALAGLMMGTRCGNIDPGVVLHMASDPSLDIEQITQILYKKSGLLGVSGISQDMRELLQSNLPNAQFAIELYAHKAAKEIASLAVDAKGFDFLVFTGGIGEKAALVRSLICQNLAVFGLRIDPQKNLDSALDISAADSSAKVIVMPTNEELWIAQSAPACALA